MVYATYLSAPLSSIQILRLFKKIISCEKYSVQVLSSSYDQVHLHMNITRGYILIYADPMMFKGTKEPC